ncbi:phospholipase D family protein [Neisseria wadsworthii]|uniref:Phospholipase D active site-containing protein n=1 Tax=Neisseria wadsworthii 9715 TaxID=1030841 RepID=G4CQD9_9NEIS|nr:phospholipase D family protein [Neisseria wadsworthii]EGZ46387.1 phospholipase D active site-containing protein [Neisseria wadsworthii 9715]
MKHTPAFLLILLLAGCQTLPPLEKRSSSRYIKAPNATRVHKVLHNSNPVQTLKADISGIYLLSDPHDAFIARATLISSAEEALDIQYYIWHNDVSGKLLMQMVEAAAKRGVRVRILLDDNNTRGMDNILTALDEHPNIEIRVFNPFASRSMRSLGYLHDFPRLNRRMHNKTFTADNKATILGGRNIGDEYFNISNDVGFADLDILATGSVVGQVSGDFDRYWASESSYPIADIAKHADLEKGRAELDYVSEKDKELRALYQSRLQSSPLNRAITESGIPWIYAPTKYISDDPAKGLDRSRNKPLITEKIDEALGSPEQEIYIVSPYFVPTKQGTEALAELSRDKVAITVFTNSLQATDVAAVHSGYARYRKKLLQAGIELYELKAIHSVPKITDKGLVGSSSSSLHAKIFIVDRKRIFIGSFNFDPRSARLNTEMGVVIEDPRLAELMQQSLQQNAPRIAYKVTLGPNNRLQWQDPQDNQVSKHEPEAKLWKRLISKIFSVMPIERLL